MSRFYVKLTGSIAVILSIYLLVVCSKLLNQRLCADAKCEEPVSFGVTVLHYKSGHSDVLSFKQNKDVIIYSKSVGDFWGGEIDGKRGYFPKRYIKETRVLKSDASLKLIPVEYEEGAEFGKLDHEGASNASNSGETNLESSLAAMETLLSIKSSGATADLSTSHYPTRSHIITSAPSSGEIRAARQSLQVASTPITSVEPSGARVTATTVSPTVTDEPAASVSGESRASIGGLTEEFSNSDFAEDDDVDDDGDDDDDEDEDEDNDSDEHNSAIWFPEESSYTFSQESTDGQEDDAELPVTVNAVDRGLSAKDTGEKEYLTADDEDGISEYMVVDGTKIPLEEPEISTVLSELHSASTGVSSAVPTSPIVVQNTAVPGMSTSGDGEKRKTESLFVEEPDKISVTTGTHSAIVDPPSAVTNTTRDDVAEVPGAKEGSSAGGGILSGLYEFMRREFEEVLTKDSASVNQDGAVKQRSAPAVETSAKSLPVTVANENSGHEAVRDSNVETGSDADLTTPLSAETESNISVDNVHKTHVASDEKSIVDATKEEEVESGATLESRDSFKAVGNGVALQPSSKAETIKNSSDTEMESNGLLEEQSESNVPLEVTTDTTSVLDATTGDSSKNLDAELKNAIESEEQLDPVATNTESESVQGGIVVEKPVTDRNHSDAATVEPLVTEVFASGNYTGNAGAATNVGKLSVAAGDVSESSVRSTVDFGTDVKSAHTKQSDGDLDQPSVETRSANKDANTIGSVTGRRLLDSKLDEDSNETTGANVGDSRLVSDGSEAELPPPGPMQIVDETGVDGHDSRENMLAVGFTEEPLGSGSASLPDDAATEAADEASPTTETSLVADDLDYEVGPFTEDPVGSSTKDGHHLNSWKQVDEDVEHLIESCHAEKGFEGDCPNAKVAAPESAAAARESLLINSLFKEDQLGAEAVDSGSWLLTLRDAIQSVLNYIPEPAHTFLYELESRAVSPRVIVFTIIVGIFVFCVEITVIAIKKYSKEKELVVKLCKLDKLFFTVSKERDELKAKLDSVNHNMTTWKTDYVGAQEMLQNLQAELESSKTECQMLQAHVASLELQLDAATEAGLELNSMLSEFLTSQSDGGRLQEAVERLQEQLESQRGQVADLQLSSDATRLENQKLRSELQMYVEKDEQASLQLQQTSEELRDSVQTVDDLRRDVSYRDDTIAELRQSNTQLLEEADAWNLSVKELQEQVRVSGDKASKATESLRSKESDLEGLKVCVAQLRSSKRDGSEPDGVDDSDGSVDAWQVLLDVARLKSELQSTVLEREALTRRLCDETKARTEAEELSKKALEDSETLRWDYEVAHQEREEATKKLEILSTYFKEKELQLQKELGVQEAFRKQSQDTATSVNMKMNLFEQEVELYKSQISSLKSEIESQERSYKNQIAGHEKKAHGNWLAARAAERRLEECRQEAAVLRNKLTLLEQEKASGQPASQAELTHNRFSNNGEGPSPPRLGPNDRYDSMDLPTSSRSSLFREPVDFPPGGMTFLPVDRPLPPPFLHRLPPAPLLPPLLPPPFDDHGPLPPPFDPRRGPPEPWMPLPPHRHPPSPPAYDQEVPSPPYSSSSSSYRHQARSSPGDHRSSSRRRAHSPPQDSEYEGRAAFRDGRNSRTFDHPPPLSQFGQALPGERPYPSHIRRDVYHPDPADGRIDPRTSSPMNKDTTGV